MQLIWDVWFGSPLIHLILQFLAVFRDLCAVLGQSAKGNTTYVRSRAPPFYSKKGSLGVRLPLGVQRVQFAIVGIVVVGKYL